MDNELKIQLTKYLHYLMTLPQTRMNNALIDCTAMIMQEKADTE